MGSDRELLTLAAKAAGYWDDEFECADRLPRFDWNPLTDDGDALRLAVLLNIFDSPEWITHRNVAFFATCAQITEATRIGIVRAAADIGSKL